jgi:hypothetical protein
MGVSFNKLLSGIGNLTLFEIPTQFPGHRAGTSFKRGSGCAAATGDSSPPVTPRPHSRLDGRLEMNLSNYLMGKRDG